MSNPAGMPVASYASATEATRHVFIDQLTLMVRIGVHAHERDRSQPILVSLDLRVSESPDEAASDKIVTVVCYEEIVRRLETLCGQGHVNLLETLAEQIADAAFVDQRVQVVRVRLDKPEAFANARSVGITIERRRRGN